MLAPSWKRQIVLFFGIFANFQSFFRSPLPPPEKFTTDALASTRMDIKWFRKKSKKYDIAVVLQNQTSKFKKFLFLFHCLFSILI